MKGPYLRPQHDSGYTKAERPEIIVEKRRVHVSISSEDERVARGDSHASSRLPDRLERPLENKYTRPCCISNLIAEPAMKTQRRENHQCTI